MFYDFPFPIKQLQ